MSLSNKLFNMLSKTPETMLISSEAKVIRKEISLETMIETGMKEIKTEKVFSILKQISGYKTSEQLIHEFPA